MANTAAPIQVTVRWNVIEITFIKGSCTPNIISDVWSVSKKNRWWVSEVKVWMGRQSNRQLITAHAAGCDVAWSTSQSCKVAWPIRNVHDQSESLCRITVVVNLIRTVAFVIILQPQMLDARYQWPHIDRIFVAQVVLGHPYDCVPVQIWSKFDLKFFLSNSMKKSTRSELGTFECTCHLTSPNLIAGDGGGGGGGVKTRNFWSKVDIRGSKFISVKSMAYHTSDCEENTPSWIASGASQRNGSMTTKPEREGDKKEEEEREQENGCRHLRNNLGMVVA